MSEQIASPGPERDAQVAKVIFGCTDDWNTWPWHGAGGPYIPRFSTDPHCALDVLVEMWQQGYRWHGYGFGTELLFIQFMHQENERQTALAHKPFADAITDAALRAKLGEANA